MPGGDDGGVRKGGASPSPEEAEPQNEHVETPSEDAADGVRAYWPQLNGMSRDTSEDVAELLDILSMARPVWDGPKPLEAVSLALAGVLTFLQTVDPANADDRQRPLVGLLGALVTLKEDGTVVPLLKPAEPSRGQPPLTPIERSTRFLAVAIADAIAQFTGKSRSKADEIVAKKLDELGMSFGHNQPSASTKLLTKERLSAYRKRLKKITGEKKLPESEREGYRECQAMLQELVLTWQRAFGATNHDEVQRRLMGILEEEVSGSLPVLRRGEGTE